MNGALTTMAIVGGALFVVSVAVAAGLMMRALRRGADFDAEMRAASFMFRIRMRPQRPHDD